MLENSLQDYLRAPINPGIYSHRHILPLSAVSVWNLDDEYNVEDITF